jgi:hypothetical protein
VLRLTERTRVCEEEEEGQATVAEEDSSQGKKSSTHHSSTFDKRSMRLNKRALELLSDAILPAEQLSATFVLALTLRKEECQL